MMMRTIQRTMMMRTMMMRTMMRTNMKTMMRDMMETYEMYYHYRKTVTEMVCDRGYHVDSELVHSLPEFRSRFGPPESLTPHSLGFRASHLSDPSNMLQVLFPGDDDVSARYMSIIYEQFIKNTKSLKKLIIVMFPRCEIDPMAKNWMKDWPFEVEIVNGCHLFFNPVRQDDGWKKYEVLTDDEKAAVVNQHELEGKELPLTSKTGRLGRYYALEEGKVFRITKVRPIANDPERVTFLLVKD